MKNLITLIIFGVLGMLSSQTSLLEINGTSYSLEDFEKTQAVNLEAMGVDKSINIFTEFRLLEQFALDSGAEHSIAFLKNYHESLTDLKETELIPPAIYNKELTRYVNKMATEYKVQVLSVDPSQKEEVSKALKKNNDFTALIEKYSRDNEFKVGKYLDNSIIDDKVYDLLITAKEGRVVGPIEINGNWIWLKLLKKRPNLGILNIQQIALKDPNSLNTVLSKIEKKEDFSALAKKYGKSDRSKLGVQTNIGFGLPDEIYEGIKNLEYGQVSGPIKMGEDVLVVKLLRKSPYVLIPESEDYFRKRFNTTEYYQKLLADQVLKFEEEGRFKRNTKNINELLYSVTKWSSDTLSYSVHNQVLFTVDDSIRYLQNDFLNNTKNVNFASLSTENLNELLEYEGYNFQKKYFENEYFFNQDRISKKIDSIRSANLISYALDELILKASYKDVDGMKQYIKDHPDKFMVDERAVLEVYVIQGESVSSQVEKMLEKGKSSKDVINKFKSQVNANNQPVVVLQEGKLEKDSPNFPENVPFEKGVYKEKGENNVYYLYHITGINPPELMSFEEARMPLLDIYQNIYYKKTLDKLKNSSKIKVNDSAVKTLKSKYEK